MRYSTYIDNVTSKKWGLSIQEAYLFDYLYSLPSWAEKATIDGHDFYFAARKKTCSELPLITDKPDTMYRYYKSLEAKNLIVLRKVDGKDYVCLTKRGKQWNRQSENSENNPKTPGKKSENDSENNPRDNIIILDNIITDNNTSADAEKYVFNCCKQNWLQKHPKFVFNGKHGRLLKQLLSNLKEILPAAAKKNPEALVSLFDHFCTKLPPLFQDKDLGYLVSSFNTIIEQITNGKQFTRKESTPGERYRS